MKISDNRKKWLKIYEHYKNLNSKRDSAQPAWPVTPVINGNQMCTREILQC